MCTATPSPHHLFYFWQKKDKRGLCSNEEEEFLRASTVEQDASWERLGVSEDLPPAEAPFPEPPPEGRRRSLEQPLREAEAHGQWDAPGNRVKPPLPQPSLTKSNVPGQQISCPWAKGESMLLPGVKRTKPSSFWGDAGQALPRRRLKSNRTQTQVQPRLINPV